MLTIIFLLILNVLIYYLVFHHTQVKKLACDECTLDIGTLRTIGDLDSCYEAYKKNGPIRSSMKEFANIMNKRLIYLNTDKNTLLENLVALPELQLLIGAVDKIAGFLLT